MEYTEYYKAFCKRVSIYRKLLGYDQGLMAEKLGMTKPEYSNRESGRSMMSGDDLKRFHNAGADIDKLLVNVERKDSKHIISDYVAGFERDSQKEYVRGVISEYVIYLCEQRTDGTNDELDKYIRLLKSIEKDSTSDSMLKCIRDANDIKDQQITSDSLGISRFKYSKIENNKEYPDAMVLIRLYDIYGYLPSMYLDVYDTQLIVLDYIYDSLSESEQAKILKFMDSIKQFV